MDLPVSQADGSTRYAFGYDPFNDNYKVVAVFGYRKYDPDYKNQVKVHSLGTDSWRRIKDFPSMFQFDRHGKSHHGVYVSYTVNWLMYNIMNGFHKCAIVSLHLGDESYQEIPLPDFGNSKKLTMNVIDLGYSTLLTLDVMRDCLCIFSQESLDSFTDVWLMKEYGNKESWIKLIRLPYFAKFSYYYTNIVYISEDENHVLLDFKDCQSNLTFNPKFKSVVYDLENNTIKSSKDNIDLIKSKVYVESLI